MGVIGNMGASALMKFPHFCTMCRLSIMQIMVCVEKGKGARTDGAEVDQCIHDVSVRSEMILLKE